MTSQARDQLIGIGFGVLYTSVMAAALLAASRFQWLADIAVPYVLLPAAGLGVLLIVLARVGEVPDDKNS